METSILNTIKKMLGIAPEYDHFDVDLIININTVFSILTQLGVGPKNGFSITGTVETWSDYISDMSKLEMVKTYIYLKVKSIFDPSQNSNVNASIEKQINELEFRLNVEVDPGKEES